MTATMTSHPANTQTTIPVETQPTTVSTTIPNQSTIDSSSTVTISATQTKSELLNTTISHTAPPTSNDDNLPGQGKKNRQLSSIIVSIYRCTFLQTMNERC